MALLEKLKRRFKPYGYELRDSTIVGNNGDSFEIDDIVEWQQIFVCMGVWYIALKTSNGALAKKRDEGDLLKILQNVLPKLEKPFGEA